MLEPCWLRGASTLGSLTLNTHEWEKVGRRSCLGTADAQLKTNAYRWLDQGVCALHQVTHRLDPNSGRRGRRFESGHPDQVRGPVDLIDRASARLCRPVRLPAPLPLQLEDLLQG